MLNLKRLFKRKANSKLDDFTLDRSVIDEKISAFTKTQALVSTAVEEAKAMAHAVHEQMALTRNEGILFLNYQGIILHANQAAHKVLDCEADKLIGKSIEALLTPKARRVTHKLTECSKALYERLKTSCTLEEITRALQQFSFYVKAKANIIVMLNATVVIPYIGHSIAFRISLFDTSPSSLEDVTYLCKISQINA